MRRPPFTPLFLCLFVFVFFLRFLVLISVRGWVDPRAIVRPEGLGKFEKIHLIGTRFRDLPARNIAPQPTTLPRDPIFGLYSLRIVGNWCPHSRKFNSCSEVLCLYIPQLSYLILYFSQFSRYFFQRNMMTIVKPNIAVIGIYENDNT
jgi:hypothetical protein